MRLETIQRRLDAMYRRARQLWAEGKVAAAERLEEQIARYEEIEQQVAAR